MKAKFFMALETRENLSRTVSIVTVVGAVLIGLAAHVMIQQRVRRGLPT